jgi:protein tyrosine/serine phosphatase
MIRTHLRNFTLALAAIMSFAVIAAAQTSPTEFPGIKIRNFGQMDENYYRGAQPNPDDYAALAQLGIKTIIDLRNDPTDYEKAAVEAAGMKYVNIPMSGWKKPKETAIKQFLDIVNDPDTGKFYVHCKAGIHRTGMTGAVYRFTKYGWDYDKAYREMKNYEFSSGLVHGALKSYVKNYAKRMETQTMTAGGTDAVSVSN